MYHYELPFCYLYRFRILELKKNIRVFFFLHAILVITNLMLAGVRPSPVLMDKREMAFFLYTTINRLGKSTTKTLFYELALYLCPPSYCLYQSTLTKSKCRNLRARWKTQTNQGLKSGSCPQGMRIMQLGKVTIGQMNELERSESAHSANWCGHALIWSNKKKAKLFWMWSNPQKWSTTVDCWWARMFVIVSI